MTIDNLTNTIAELEKYERPKINILNKILEILRTQQSAGDVKNLKEEMSDLQNILRRIDAVIPGEMRRFKENKKIIQTLERQRELISELMRFSTFYQANTDIVILNNLYNKIYEAITNFITLSKSLISIKSFKKTA